MTNDHYAGFCSSIPLFTMGRGRVEDFPELMTYEPEEKIKIKFPITNSEHEYWFTCDREGQLKRYEILKEIIIKLQNENGKHSNKD